MYLELILALSVISLASLIGVFFIGINHKKLENYLETMVAFSIGALLGGVFIHMLPELSEEVGITLEISLTILAGVITFFILEKFIHWHHCHRADHKKEVVAYPYTILAGDSLHNLIDGIILAGAFLASPTIGFSTTIAIFLHEVPQEIGDFGVLLKGGFSKKKALAANFLTALTAFIGAGLALLFNALIEGVTPFFIAFAAGSFLYIAGTDLLPELNKNFNSKKAIIHLIAILFGIFLMSALILLE